MMAIKYRLKDSAHTTYRNAKGERIPGASTISNILSKPQLVPWANKLGLNGIEVGKYVDGLADAGTLAHYLSECVFQGKERDSEIMDEYSKADLDRATVSFDKFMDWYSARKIAVVGSELQLVSENLQVGGTVDVIAWVDGVFTLIDIKTSKALYGPGDDKWIQCAGYDLIAEENHYLVDEVRILRLGRDAEEGFEYALMPHREDQRQLFRLCREVYEVRRRIGR